jgi:hypothetical protein
MRTGKTNKNTIQLNKDNDKRCVVAGIMTVPLLAVLVKNY